MTARRTTCRWCATPLTRAQQRRGNEFCGRRCAKLRDHRRDPGFARRAGAQSWLKVGRPRYVARLAETLRGCPSMAEAYRRGYRAGYTVGANRRRTLARKAA